MLATERYMYVGLKIKEGRGKEGDHKWGGRGGRIERRVRVCGGEGGERGRGGGERKGGGGRGGELLLIVFGRVCCSIIYEER